MINLQVSNLSVVLPSLLQLHSWLLHPQNKLLRIISNHTGNNITILTSVHSPYSPTGISCKLFRVNQRWIGWVETSLHSSIQSCWVRLVVSVASNLIQKNSCTDSIKSIFADSKTKNISKISWNFGGNRILEYLVAHFSISEMKRFKQYWSTFEKMALYTEQCSETAWLWNLVISLP